LCIPTNHMCNYDFMCTVSHRSEMLVNTDKHGVATVNWKIFVLKIFRKKKFRVKKFS